MHKINQTPRGLGRRALQQGPCPGFKQRGLFEIFATVAPIGYQQVKVPSCAFLRLKRRRGQRGMLLFWETRNPRLNVNLARNNYSN